MKVEEMEKEEQEEVYVDMEESECENYSVDPWEPLVYNRRGAVVEDGVGIKGLDLISVSSAVNEKDLKGMEEELKNLVCPMRLHIILGSLTEFVGIVLRVCTF